MVFMWVFYGMRGMDAICFDCKSNNNVLQLIKSMRPTEVQSSIPAVQIMPDRKPSQAWELFVERLATRFHLDLSRVGMPMYMDIPGSTLCLGIQRENGYMAIAYGARTHQGLLPDIQIVFDVSNEAGWTPAEVHYSPALAKEFRDRKGFFRENNRKEEYIGFEEFAGYVLDKIKKELLLDHLSLMS